MKCPSLSPQIALPLTARWRGWSPVPLTARSRDPLTARSRGWNARQDHDSEEWRDLELRARALYVSRKAIKAAVASAATGKVAEAEAPKVVDVPVDAPGSGSMGAPGAEADTSAGAAAESELHRAAAAAEVARATAPSLVAVDAPAPEPAVLGTRSGRARPVACASNMKVNSDSMRCWKCQGCRLVGEKGKRCRACKECKQAQVCPSRLCVLDPRYEKKVAAERRRQAEQAKQADAMLYVLCHLDVRDAEEAAWREARHCKLAAARVVREERKAQRVAKAAAREASRNERAAAHEAREARRRAKGKAPKRTAGGAGGPRGVLAAWRARGGAAAGASGRSRPVPERILESNGEPGYGEHVAEPARPRVGLARCVAAAVPAMPLTHPTPSEIASRLRSHLERFLVLWSGQSRAAATWEPGLKLPHHLLLRDLDACRAAFNRTVEPLLSLPADDPHCSGVVATSVDAAHAAACAAHLQRHWVNGRLLLRKGTKSCSGYTTYGKVLEQHDMEQQRTHTLLITHPLLPLLREEVTMQMATALVTTPGLRPNACSPPLTLALGALPAHRSPVASSL